VEGNPKFDSLMLNKFPFKAGAKLALLPLWLLCEMSFVCAEITEREKITAKINKIVFIVETNV